MEHDRYRMHKADDSKSIKVRDKHGDIVTIQPWGKEIYIDCTGLMLFTKAEALKLTKGIEEVVRRMK